MAEGGYHSAELEQIEGLQFSWLGDMIATMTFMCILIVYLLCLYYTFKNKNLLHPINIFLTSMVPPYVIIYLTNVELHTYTSLFYLITIISFILGYFYLLFVIAVYPNVTSSRTCPNLDPRSQLRFNKIKHILYIFILIGLVGFMLGLFKAYEFSQMGPSSAFFNLRYATIVLDMDIGFPKYMLLFLHISTLLMIIYRKYNYSIILASIWCITSFFTMARTELLLAILSIVSAYYLSSRFIYRDTISSKPFIMAGIIFIIFFFGIAFVTHRINPRGLLSTFIDYYLYPIITFDQYVLGYDKYTFGWYTLYPFTKFLSIIGCQSEPLEIGPYIPPGQPNVYTMMGGPYIDYGNIGLIIVPFFLGLIYAIIYRGVIKCNIYSIVFYSLYTYPLVLSFFAYQYSLASWLYYLSILFIIKCWDFFTNMRREDAG